MIRLLCRRSTLAVVGLAAIAFALPATVALAASGNAASHWTGHCDPSSTVCGSNPLLTGPPPPFVTIPANCPAFLSTDTWSLDFVGGSSVFHETTNANGDWGGFTAQGQADFTTHDGTVQYVGHATVWGGGGNNAASQTEGGFTLNFSGSGIAGNLSIHIDGHQTTNNSGTSTADVRNVSVTC